MQTAKYIYYYNYNMTDVVNKIGVFRREIFVKENNYMNEKAS